MNDQPALRAIGALDLDDAAALHRQAFERMGERPWTRQDIAELLAVPTVGGLFVDVQDHAAGMVLWRMAADEAELLTITVHHDHRRAGLGRILLMAMVDRVRQAGTKNIFLEVGADNPAALSLYAQAGFREVGRRSAYYTRPTGTADALVLRLTLIGDG
jgi:ribosomal-protein-alanine N-acetyltransferase